MLSFGRWRLIDFRLLTLNLDQFVSFDSFDSFCDVIQQVFIYSSSFLNLHLRLKGLSQLDVRLSDLIDLLLQNYSQDLNRRLIVGNGFIDCGRSRLLFLRPKRASQRVFSI